MTGSQGVGRCRFVFAGLPVLCLSREAAAFHALVRMGAVGCSYGTQNMV